MQVGYEAWLALLSVIIAIQGAYVALNLAVQIGASSGARRRLLLAGSAFSLGIAIWAMHFVGMLAARLPFPIDYLVFPTLLSFLVCVIVVGAAVYTTTSGPFTLVRLTFSSCLMGAGIFSMHYIGMSALDASTFMIHDPRFVASSMAIAIAASGLALWLANGPGTRPPLMLSAVAFGVAISGMHYTAMAGMTLFPHLTGQSGAPALSTDLLAIVVAVVAFCISGIFLLVLVPDRSKAANEIATPGIPSPSLAANRRGGLSAASTSNVAVDFAQFGHGTYAPLGGAGTPPRRTAQRLPVEREGATHFVAVEDVVAVHANAHYTYIFDGTCKLFCPLAIGEVEARLDKSRFMRVHRSHIVNIDRVTGHKRSGDNEIVELAAAGPYTVPVSRSRIGWLKSRIGGTARLAPEENYPANSAPQHSA